MFKKLTPIALILGAALFLVGCGDSDNAVASNNSNTNNNANNNNNGNQNTISLTFTGNSNAITNQFAASTVVTGTLGPAANGATGLLSQLTEALTTPPVGTRSININISDTSTLAVNDVFNVVPSGQAAPRASINYTQQTTAGTLAFSSQAGGGTLRITSLTPGSGVSGTIGIEFTNVNLSPVTQGGNSATGTLTINGTATLTF